MLGPMSVVSGSMEPVDALRPTARVKAPMKNLASQCRNGHRSFVDSMNGGPGTSVGSRTPDEDRTQR
jgi:hypothetical protein